MRIVLILIAGMACTRSEAAPQRSTWRPDDATEYLTVKGATVYHFYARDGRSCFLAVSGRDHEEYGACLRVGEPCSSQSREEA